MGPVSLCHRGTLFLNASDAYQKAKVVLLGAPMDITSSFRRGSQQGPLAVRIASDGLEDYSPALDRVLGEPPFYDSGDLDLPPGSLRRSLQMIAEAAHIIGADRKLPFLIGGEHLISYAAIKSAAALYPELSVLHFDAHADLREEYLGERFSHATVIRRVGDFVEAGRIYQFGIRSGTREEFCYGKRYTNFYPGEFLSALSDLLPQLTGGPLYVTIDLDIIDPAYAPGTGTPEPEGCTPNEMLEAVRLLRGLRIVGCDLVELSPPYDRSGITSLLAAKLVRECLLSFSEQFLDEKEPAEKGKTPGDAE